jgi:hypothetical protein
VMVTVPSSVGSLIVNEVLGRGPAALAIAVFACWWPISSLGCTATRVRPISVRNRHHSYRGNADGHRGLAGPLGPATD